MLYASKTEEHIEKEGYLIRVYRSPNSKGKEESRVSVKKVLY